MAKKSVWMYLVLSVLSFILLSSCEEDSFQDEENEVPDNLNNDEIKINLDNSILAYYPLDGNANDLSMNENHASIIGGKFSSDQSGHALSAFHITAKSNALDIPDFSNEQISVSLWYYFEGAGSFWNTLLYGNSSRHHLIISHANGSGETGEIGSYASGFKGSTKVLEVGQWYHLVLTKDNANTNIYVDNTLVFSNQDFSNALYPLTVIGNYTAENGTQGALGKLDEINIFDRVLNEDEINYLFNKR